MIHGTQTAYINHGCHCPACKQANRERHRRWRQSGPPVYQHGASAYSNQGCRCEVCSEANRAKCRAFYLARRLPLPRRTPRQVTP